MYFRGEIILYEIDYQSVLRHLCLIRDAMQEFDGR